MDVTQHTTSVADLAAETGVLTQWVDAWGRRQQIEFDDLFAVLGAVTGRPIDTEKSIAEAVSDLRAEKPAIEPVIVAWDGLMPTVRADAAVESASIALESGGEVPAVIDNGVVRVASALPLGYHQLVVNGGEHVSHIFSAPKKVFPAPCGALGLMSPTYSLRPSNGDKGVGSIAELTQMADICYASGVSVVGTLPLLAAFSDEPSPYAPVSRRAWNELFVDLSSVPDWSEPDPVGSRDPSWVDYGTAGAQIRSALARYADHVSNTPMLRSQVESFLDAEPEMRRYAEFRSLTDTNGRNWRFWSGAERPHQERTAYHETVQWLMHTQLAQLSSRLSDRGQHLYLDLPVGCHADGYDVWDDPDLFALASLGAPPDTMFDAGQDWGLPAAIPHKARLDGHTNFRKALRHQLSVAGLLRVDHVMGIHRAWWVPYGLSSTQGAYVRQPTEELFAVICIESVRAEAGIVGENLGTVPPEINRGISTHDLLGMVVAQHGVDEPSPSDLIAASSHDTPPFAAWWVGSDIDDMCELGIFDDDRAQNERSARASTIAELESRFETEGLVATRDALMAWIAGTDAAVAVVSLDDLLLEERRQNVPGTNSERPNWRLRYARTVDELATDDGFVDELRKLVALRPAMGQQTPSRTHPSE